jgi:hypothetical protein
LRGSDDREANGVSKAWDALGDFTTTTRLLPISALAVGIGVVAAFVALALLRLIGLFTNFILFRSMEHGAGFAGGQPSRPL